MSDLTFSEEEMNGADDAANRMTESGAYVGTFTQAFELVKDSGSKGISFTFQDKAGGQSRFDVYTWSGKDGGRKIFGASLIQAALYLLGLRSAPGVEGTIQSFGETKEAVTYPALCGKPIGVVLQKELTSKQDGSDTFRMNLVGFYDPRTSLTATEKKEGASKPEKLEKMLKGLKTKDSRKARVAGPVGGGGAGDYADIAF